jgi:hypothetical protein
MHALGHVANAASRLSSASRQVVSGGIAQDNIIFAMLLFAFVVWITTKGELKTYLAFFAPGTGAGPPVQAATASSTTSANVVPSTTNPVTGSQIQPGVSSNPFAGLTGGSGIFGTNLGSGIMKMFGF